MAKGGAREGAGRKKETPNVRKRLTVEDIKRAREGGEMPHEFLLRIARGETIQMNTPIGKVEYMPTFAERVTAAVNCAPYFVPRLNAIEAKIEQSTKFEIRAEPLPEAEWLRLYGNDNSVGPAIRPTESSD